MAVNGNKVGSDTVEIVYRDVPQADPAQSKALAQELIVKEKVQYLAKLLFHPRCDGGDADPEAGQCADGHHERRHLGDRHQEPACRPHLVYHLADLDADRQGRLRCSASRR